MIKIDLDKPCADLTDQERQLLVVRNHARTDGWWDGSVKYQTVNRNVIAMIQRDMFFSLISTIYGGKDMIGLGIGGRHTDWDYYYEINVNPGCAPDIWADARWLPFKDNSVDYITSSHTLEHIPNMHKTLTEWIRVLKSSGVIAITLPDKTHFLHDNENPNHKWYDIAPSEVTAEEFQKILDKLENVDVLQFNMNQNNMDMECLLRKKVAS